MGIRWPATTTNNDLDTGKTGVFLLVIGDRYGYNVRGRRSWLDEKAFALAY